MRPKFVLGVLLAALGLAGVIAWVSNSLRPRPPLPASEHAPAPPAAAETTEPAAAATPLPTANDGVPIPAGPAVHTNEESADAAEMRRVEHEDYVDRRTAELNDLAMENDAAARDAILAELRNPDKAIRTAALEAAIQFGDRSIVPRLQEIAAQTEDPEEKATILEAADFINLPSMTEYLAQQNITGTTQPKTNAVRAGFGNPFGRRPPRDGPSRQPPSVNP